jgi:hypothetical protein
MDMLSDVTNLAERDDEFFEAKSHADRPQNAKALVLTRAFGRKSDVAIA